MLKTTSKSGVTTLTLDNPKQRNALTREMIDAFARVLSAADAERRRRAGLCGCRGFHAGDGTGQPLRFR